MKRTAARRVSETPVRKNIESITRLEHEALHSLTRGERLSTAIAGFAGSLRFVFLHIGWFGLWYVVNAGLLPGVTPFDPFPFSLLTMVVSLEAIFLSIILLINQNAMLRQSERRAHLNLQVDMLAEQEATQMLRMLRRVCDRLDVQTDDLTQELRELAKETDVHQVLEDLKEQLPSEQ
jgi:uncharacterized membrane protein